MQSHNTRLFAYHSRLPIFRKAAYHHKAVPGLVQADTPQRNRFPASEQNQMSPGLCRAVVLPHRFRLYHRVHNRKTASIGAGYRSGNNSVKNPDIRRIGCSPPFRVLAVFLLLPHRQCPAVVVSLPGQMVLGALPDSNRPPQAQYPVL